MTYDVYVHENNELARQLATITKRTRTYMSIIQTYGTCDRVPVCGPKSFRQRTFSFYNIQSDCMVHSCLIQ